MNRELTIRVSMANSDILPWFIVNKLQGVLPPGATISGSDVHEDVAAPEVTAYLRNAAECGARMHGNKNLEQADQRILELEKDIMQLAEYKDRACEQIRTLTDKVQKVNADNEWLKKQNQHLTDGYQKMEKARTGYVDGLERSLAAHRCGQVQADVKLDELARHHQGLHLQFSQDALASKQKAVDEERRAGEKKLEGLRHHIKVAVQTSARQERQACAEAAQEWLNKWALRTGSKHATIGDAILNRDT